VTAGSVRPRARQRPARRRSAGETGRWPSRPASSPSRSPTLLRWAILIAAATP